MSHALGQLGAAVRGLGTGYREVGADAVLLTLDRGAGSTGWWDQPREGRFRRPRRVGQDCEISLWASWSARESLGESILLTTLRRLFHGRQICMGGMMIALEGLNR